jgi:hypothetical protein
MSKKNLTWFQSLMVLMANQRGEIRLGYGPRRLMDEKDGDGEGGGGDDGKGKDGQYSKEFVEKLLKEKNNHRDAKVKAELELQEIKKKLEKGAGGDDGKGGGGEDSKLKELLKLKDEENAKTKSKLEALEKERTEGVKLGTLREEFEKAGGDPKKFPLIQRLAETSKVLIDEDSGVVYGAADEVKRIKELAPELFGKPKKGVNDGDTSSSTQHDQDQTGDEAVKKALEGKRLKKEKDGKNPFEAIYLAKGLKIQNTRP